MGITVAGIYRYKVDGNDDANVLFDALTANIQGWSSERFVLALGRLVSAGSGVPPSMLMGVETHVTAQQYKAWTDRNNKDVYPVGPMILFKLLHRAEILWTYEMVFDRPWVTFTRNGKNISTCCKYALDIDEDDVHKHPVFMREFLDGITHKGKQVQYVHVDYRVLRFLDYYNSHHDIVSPGGGKPVVITNNLSPPQHHDYLTSLFPSITKYLLADPIIVNVADEILDVISRRLQCYFEEDQLVFIARAIDEIDADLEQSTAQYLKHLQHLSTLAEEDRLLNYKRLFGVSSDASDALRRLKEARKIRNNTPTQQYVEKNVGSPGAAHLPQAFETTLKFHNIHAYLKAESLLPTQMVPQPHSLFYGVAYMHGGKVVEEIVGGKKNVTLYDIGVAKDSTEALHYGNVFNIKAPGCYVFDDAETKKKLGSDKANVYKLNNLDTGDVAKLAAYCKGATSDERPIYVLSKVSLTLFEDERIRKVVKAILYPDDKAQPYTYVRLRKFGKLHNAECFLELSNHKNHVGYNSTWKEVMGDVQSVSSMISVANLIVMLGQDLGVRLAAPKCIVKKDAMSQSKEVTPWVIWRTLLSASNTDCPWYSDAFKLKLSGGSGMLQSAVDLSDDYADVVYADRKRRTPNVQTTVPDAFDANGVLVNTLSTAFTMAATKTNWAKP